MKARWFGWLIPILVLIWVVNVSKPGSLVEGCLDGCATPPDKDAEVLRVVSLNMLHGFPKFEYLAQRLEIIAEEINRLEVDIVLLQEVPWTLQIGNAARFLSEKTGMNYVYLRANGNRRAIAFEEGESILSRYPLINPSLIELQPQAGFFQHRVVLHADARTRMGKVGLYVTHLTHNDPEINLAQSDNLKTFVRAQDSVFTIVAGDFNAQPESPQIRDIVINWVDPFDHLQTQADGYTCCNDVLDVKTAEPSKRIDYIFLVSGSNTPRVNAKNRVFTQPNSSGNSWLWASDHIGLYVDLTLDP
jgi:endonuclease/exonuclease/phosphatase family metal-dependent hydrolase